MKNVLIVGCGDIGERIAALYKQKELPVSGIVKSEHSVQRLHRAGIDAVQMDLSQSVQLEVLLTKAATIIYLAPPPNEGEADPMIREFLAGIAEDALPEKLVLLSTTAVYGDCQGKWITENQPVNPQTARGRRRLDAEQAAQEWSANTGVPVVILRVGGIYGAGRLPIARLEKGLPILNETESPFTNRIHQDDLAQIFVAAVEYGRPGEVYNVSDGQPGTMSGYFKAIAKSQGLPMPPEVSLAEAQEVMSAGMLSYLKESRRMDNRKVQEELGITLQYPDLDAGLLE